MQETVLLLIQAQPQLRRRTQHCGILLSYLMTFKVPSVLLLYKQDAHVAILPHDLSERTFYSQTGQFSKHQKLLLQDVLVWS